MKKNNSKETNSKFKNRGFTLVETLVAISIFTTSILAMLVLLSQSISNTGYAKRKVIATYLAQEGIEYMRNMRDTFVLYNSTSQFGWDQFNEKLGDGSCTNLPNGCYFDADNIDFENTDQPMTDVEFNSCGTSCPALLYDDGAGTYKYNIGINSGYRRKITASVISADETRIFSTVYWTQGSGTYNIVFSESLFNWVE